MDLSCMNALKRTLALTGLKVVRKWSTTHCRHTCKYRTYCKDTIRHTPLMLKAIEVPAPQTIWPFIKYSNASTKEEFCKIPRKKFLNEAPDPELTSRMQKTCMKSHHPNIHICKKKPETDFARKVHREVKGLLKRLKKKERFTLVWIYL